MRRKLIFGLGLFLITLGLIALSPHSSVGQASSPSLKMMCGGMMDGGMMDGGMMGDNHEDMQIVHQLFAHHDQIRRSVETIPGGVQTVTESDNPEIAALIRQHVTSMHQRLEQGRWFAMMSRTLPILFDNADRYQRQSQPTDQGIRVTKTADDPELAAVLRDHAQEVSGFVDEGMPCGSGGMMPR